MRAVLTRRTATTTTTTTTTTIAEHLSQQVLRNLRNKRTFTRVTMLTSSLLWLYAGCWNIWLHDTRWSVCGCVSSLSLFSCICFVSFWVMKRVRIVLPHGTFIALKTSIHCIVHHVFRAICDCTVQISYIQCTCMRSQWSNKNKTSSTASTKIEIERRELPMRFVMCMIRFYFHRIVIFVHFDLL